MINLNRCLEIWKADRVFSNVFEFSIDEPLAETVPGIRIHVRYSKADDIPRRGRGLGN